MLTTQYYVIIRSYRYPASVGVAGPCLELLSLDPGVAGGGVVVCCGTTAHHAHQQPYYKPQSHLQERQTGFKNMLYFD